MTKKILYTCQISSGRGPEECQLAARLFLEEVKKESVDFFPLEILTGNRDGCILSATFKTHTDFRPLEGSIEWICKSPFRPDHKRKNWFVDFSIIEKEEDYEINTERKSMGLEKRNIKFMHFRSGGKGGQNVNKVETAVRLVDTKSGIAVTASRERSQLLNRRIAEEKLLQAIENKELSAMEGKKNSAWKKHTELVRGKAVRVYKGMKFTLVKK